MTWAWATFQFVKSSPLINTLALVRFPAWVIDEYRVMHFLVITLRVFLPQKKNQPKLCSVTWSKVLARLAAKGTLASWEPMSKTGCSRVFCNSASQLLVRMVSLLNYFSYYIFCWSHTSNMPVIVFTELGESTEYTVLIHISVYIGKNQNYYSLSPMQI